MKHFLSNNQSGQTLVMLLVFVVVTIAITTTAVAVLINTTRAASGLGSTIEATLIADSGVENALLRMLRDPGYTGETLPVGDGTAIITVTGASTQTITSVGTVGNFMKTAQVVVTYTNNVMSVSSWNYIY